MHQLNKFYILLLLATVTAGAIFAVQFNKTKKITVKQSDSPLISQGYYDIPTENDDYILGNPGAPLTVVLFNDYSCKDCRLKYTTITNFVKEHPQDARLFLKDLPKKSLFYKTNDLSNRAVFCAGKQNKYWQFADALSTENNISNESDLTKIANNLKLNTTYWWQCVNSDEAKQKIARSIDLATILGVEQAPAIYVNNKKINLDKDLDISDMLKKFIAK